MNYIICKSCVIRHMFAFIINIQSMTLSNFPRISSQLIKYRNIRLKIAQKFILMFYLSMIFIRRYWLGQGLKSARSSTISLTSQEILWLFLETLEFSTFNSLKTNTLNNTQALTFGNNNHTLWLMTLFHQNFTHPISSFFHPKNHLQQIKSLSVFKYRHFP